MVSRRRRRRSGWLQIPTEAVVVVAFALACLSQPFIDGTETAVVCDPAFATSLLVAHEMVPAFNPGMCLFS